MKFVIIDNFLTKDLSLELIKQIDDTIDFSKEAKIHNNRSILTSTSSNFTKLLQNSKIWRELEEKINSEKFLKYCCDKININSSDYCLENFFKKNKKNFAFKEISEKKIKTVSTLGLIKYVAYRLYLSATRKIKFFFSKKKPLELLFDVSRAGNGYFNHIHRDSDSRLVVFLLYLNSLDKTTNSEGGELIFHKLIKNDKNLATPDSSSCETIQTISPEAGKLVIFLNEDNSYHSVSKMNNQNQHRYFLYGGFTLLSGKNPYINKSKLKTDFYLYD